MQMNKLKAVLTRLSLVLILVLGFSNNATLAAMSEPEPLVLMKRLSNSMLAELNKNIAQLKTNKDIIYAIVNRVLVPNFDLVGISRSVIGRNYWTQASANDQKRFTKEFTRYIVSTYATALRSYNGEEIQFLPLPSRVAINDRVVVSSKLWLKNGPAVSIQYSLVKQATKWLIYDFSVDGISFVKSYNAQISAKYGKVLAQSGLPGLINALHERNLADQD